MDPFGRQYYSMQVVEINMDDSETKQPKYEFIVEKYNNVNGKWIVSIHMKA